MPSNGTGRSSPCPLRCPQEALLVASLRENDLGNLDLDDRHLRQLSFRPNFGRVDDVVAELVGWAREQQPGTR